MWLDLVQLSAGFLEAPGAAFQEKMRYGAALVAWLFVGGGAWFVTRNALSKKPEEKALRGRVGRSAFLSGGFLGAILAFLFSGSGPGLGGGGEGGGVGAGAGLGANTPTPSSAAAPSSAPASEPASAPAPALSGRPVKQEAILLLERDPVARQVRYLLDGAPVAPEQLGAALERLRQQSPSLQAVRFVYERDAPAADVLVAQKALGALPGLRYTVEQLAPASLPGDAPAPASAPRAPQ